MAKSFPESATFDVRVEGDMRLVTEAPINQQLSCLFDDSVRFSLEPDDVVGTDLSVENLMADLTSMDVKEAERYYEMNDRVKSDPYLTICAFRVNRYADRTVLQRCKELLQRTGDGYSSSIPVSDASVAEIFGGARNVVIGENHNSSVFAKYVLGNASGVKKRLILAESFPANLQNEIDQFLAKNKDMNSSLAVHCASLDLGFLDLGRTESGDSEVTSLLNVVRSLAQQKGGVRLLAIDPYGMDYGSGDVVSGLSRITSLNYLFEMKFAKLMLEDYFTGAFDSFDTWLNGGVMACCGNAHMSLYEDKGSKFKEPGIIARLDRAAINHLFLINLTSLYSGWEKNLKKDVDDDRSKVPIYGGLFEMSFAQYLHEEMHGLIYSARDSWVHDFTAESITDGRGRNLTFSNLRGALFQGAAVIDLKNYDPLSVSVKRYSGAREVKEAVGYFQVLDNRGSQDRMKDYQMTMPLVINFPSYLNGSNPFFDNKRYTKDAAGFLGRLKGHGAGVEVVRAQEVLDKVDVARGGALAQVRTPFDADSASSPFASGVGLGGPPPITPRKVKGAASSMGARYKVGAKDGAKTRPLSLTGVVGDKVSAVRPQSAKLFEESAAKGSVEDMPPLSIGQDLPARGFVEDAPSLPIDNDSAEDGSFGMGYSGVESYESSYDSAGGGGIAYADYDLEKYIPTKGAAAPNRSDAILGGDRYDDVSSYQVVPSSSPPQDLTTIKKRRVGVKLETPPSRAVESPFGNPDALFASFEKDRSGRGGDV